MRVRSEVKNKYNAVLVNHMKQDNCDQKTIEMVMDEMNDSKKS